MTTQTTTTNREAPMHVTTVTPAEPETPHGDGAYSITCTACGPVVTYRGRWFTQVEAERHERYFARKAAKR